MPTAWADLITAITILAKHPSDNHSPFWCEHDTLHVLAHNDEFDAADIAELDRLGFHIDTDGGFYSFRYA